MPPLPPLAAFDSDPNPCFSPAEAIDPATGRCSSLPAHTNQRRHPSVVPSLLLAGRHGISPSISSRIRRGGWYLFVETHGVCR
jgi:hypothetical protein